MTREQIEDKAMEIAKEVCGSFDAALEYANGFAVGAEWRINSIWHDINERPKFPGKVECVKFLLLRKNGGCNCFLMSKCDWDDFIDAEFVKWAYIDDLLPERKEESK